MNRFLMWFAALFWGLQFALLSPVLALLLVELFGATAGEVGWAMAVYNGSGFLASLVLPAYADRRGDYLRPMLWCGVLGLLLAGALSFATSLPLAMISLIVLGGPAGVGVSLLFAQLKHAGADKAEVMNIRALFSFAWVAGPPLGTTIMGWFGNRSVLFVLAGVAVLNVATTVVMVARERSAPAETEVADGPPAQHQPITRPAMVAVLLGFVALQATNSAAMSIMSLFVTERLGLAPIWAGAALAVAALLEIPAFVIIGRLGRRFSDHALLSSGCIAGIAYYAGMTFVGDPVTLLALQVLNAWFFGVVSGVGMTLFQQIIARPGLATGLFMNTRRIGAIISGPIIGFGGATAAGYQGIFAVCLVATVIGGVLIEVARRLSVTPGPQPER